jgi:glycosyltransferase involved in cell wall biosynthesis
MYLSRIMYLASAIIPSRTANSVQVMKMCHAFAADGHEVRLLVPDHKTVEPGVRDVFAFYGVAPNFSLQKLIYPNVRGQTTLAALHAALLIRRHRPDLVYSRWVSLCHRQSLFTRVPLALEVHMPLRDDMVAPFTHLIRRPSFRHLLVISQALRDWFVDAFPELEGRIQVVPDGADPPASNLLPVPLRREGRLLAGYCGQLFPGKGVEIVVELARSMPEVDFHVVGGEGGDITRWREHAAGLGNLIFHGFLPTLEAQRYIAAVDVALAPYQQRVAVHGGRGDVARWMSPLKIFEYMALGKAIVSSDLPVLREILRDDLNALLCPPANLDAWQAALRRLSDPAVRKRLGDKAQRDFRDNYSWAQRVRRITAIAGAHSERVGRSAAR